MKQFSWFMAFMYALVISLMLIPFSAIVVEILFSIELIASVFICICTSWNKYTMLTKKIQVFSIYSMAVNIMLTKNLLLGLYKNIEIPIVLFLGKLCCSDNLIVGIVFTLDLLIITVLLVIRGAKQIHSGAIMDESTRFLSGSVKSIILMVAISLMLGTVIKMLNCESMHEAITPVVMYTTANTILYVMPLIIVTIAVVICVTKDRYIKDKK